MELFKQRIKDVCQHAGGKKSLAKALGYPQPTVHNWIAGLAKPSFQKITLICEKTGFNPAWLAFGEGPMRPGEEVLPPPAWEQEKVELEKKMRTFKHMRDNFDSNRREIEAGKREIEAGKREIEAGKREIEKLRAQSFLGAQREIEAGKRENELLREMKQLPPPPTAGGGVADMTMLGLAECGLEGWLLKKPLSAKAVCPADMNPAEDFAVIATGQSLFHAGIEPGFTCFCAAKSAPRVGDIVYVLKPSNTASLGLVRELEHKEKGSEVPWLVLQKWHDLDPKTGLREPYTLRENRDKLVEIVPVIYVQRRPI